VKNEELMDEVVGSFRDSAGKLRLLLHHVIAGSLAHENIATIRAAHLDANHNLNHTEYVE
jgi:hypothetical protein